jgi:hypothetical protein
MFRALRQFKTSEVQASLGLATATSQLKALELYSSNYFRDGMFSRESIASVFPPDGGSCHDVDVD